jgi:hypothetical protein
MQYGLFPLAQGHSYTTSTGRNPLSCTLSAKQVDSSFTQSYPTPQVLAVISLMQISLPGEPPTCNLSAAPLLRSVHTPTRTEIRKGVTKTFRVSSQTYFDTLMMERQQSHLIFLKATARKNGYHEPNRTHTIWR